MTITTRGRLASLTLCGLVSWTGPACAGAVEDWNAIANDAVAAGRPGPSGVLDLALVQAAVHDAVQALDRRFEPYFAEVPGGKGRKSGAVAAAAHGLLVAFYPAQMATLDQKYADYIANNSLEGNFGLEVGQKVADIYVPLRRMAPAGFPDFIGGTGVGQWRPTDSLLGNPPAPPPFSPMATPWVATETDPFTLTGAARFRAAPPPALTSEQYRKDYEEVKAFGAFASTALTTLLRTPAQTDIGYFYSENFLAQWNRAIRGITATHVHNIGDNARLYALANLAAADAFITAWDSKKFYFFWRPVTAIHEGDNDTNTKTAGDPNWQSLINNPNYPDYTSGANNLTGAFMGMLRLFFGTDKVTFDVTSNAPLAVQKTRTYKRFSAAAQDVVNARIYLGIHFRFADTAAREQGTRVAEWTYDHFLLPTR